MARPRKSPTPIPIAVTDEDCADELTTQELDSPAPPGLETAQAAGLVYIMDGEPGFTRKKRGKHFIYLDLQGCPITDEAILARIQSLAIPPAWEKVWISPDSEGHIQATGRDKKGRKQYRYHPRWTDLRSQTKFDRILQFGQALPALRTQVDHDLGGTKLTRQKVAALVIRLLEYTLIRVGNQEYARLNNSYGLTTLHDDHIQITGSTVALAFVGKRGKPFDVAFSDRRLANLVRRCQELPGQNLFQYVDEHGECCQVITSGDVNSYLREATGQDFTAKDFRTWGGTVRAAVELYQSGPAPSEKAADKTIVRVVKQVSGALNNTPAVCRKYYIHPAVLEAYKNGRLFEEMTRTLAENQPTPRLAIDEQAVIDLLEAK